MDFTSFYDTTYYIEWLFKSIITIISLINIYYYLIIIHVHIYTYIHTYIHPFKYTYRHLMSSYPTLERYFI
jgi:hypothetical protein